MTAKQPTPDFHAQFRTVTEPSTTYMGGTAMSCGQHPSLPKRHRWTKWEYPHGRQYRERRCTVCALTEGDYPDA